jgi:uncharacterized membrane protein
MFVPVMENQKYLLLVVCAYLFAEYAYFIEFIIIKDTTILLAVDNLSIPKLYYIHFLILKEELNRNKIIGSSLIVLGGAIAAL